MYGNPHKPPPRSGRMQGARNLASNQLEQGGTSYHISLICGPVEVRLMAPHWIASRHGYDNKGGR